MQYYYYVEVCGFDGPELISEIESLAMEKFSSSGIEDFSIEENRVDEILGERSYSGADIPISVIEEVEQVVTSDRSLVKKIYFTSKNDATSFINSLENFSNLKSKLIEMPVEDWNETWRETYSPIEVSSDFEIVPSWNKEDYKSDKKNKLYIYPGMGFGTGSHETTFLCMKLMLETDSFFKGVRCLDFGCGSGILALGLRLLQPDSNLDLYDIEKEALDNCIQNIELNEFSMDQISLLLPDQRKVIDKKYNLIFANILKNVLEIEKKYLTTHVEKNGYLILSGLLKEQEEDIISQYEKANSNLVLQKVERKGDWIAVLFKHQ